MANIKNFDCNVKKQLTKNINTKELKCLGKGHIHNTVIDLDHINKVQAFMDWAGYDRVDFSCCYRCKQYEKSKGRSGTSQHCISCASDQKFSKNGKAVSAKEVCCKAQDYGFKGIGYIDKYYVHLDSRSKGTYRGDETKGYTNNVPNGDFYAYFGIKRDGETPKEEVYNLTRTLKKGCKGDDVKKLQSKLIELGYSVGKYGADKNFGKDTEKAVKKFQKDHKLEQDGKVGPATSHALGWTYNGK